jgi:tetratricopeptide (TPR) repeat protein
VVIEPFTLNSELQSKGYDGQMVAAMLVHNIVRMVREADSVKQDQSFSVPLSTKLPDVEIPETKISIKTIIRYLREFPPFRYVRRLFGINPIRVEGEALLNGELLTINLRISKNLNGSSWMEAKTFSRDLEGKIERINSLFTETSQYILEDAEPYLWAVFLYRNKRADDALAQIQYCIHQNGTEHAEFALALWSLILIDQKKYDEAITKLEEATKRESSGENPALAAVYNNWGLALLNQGKFDEAIVKFEEAIRRDPNHALAYNNYGKAFLEKGETKKGIEKLGQALKLDPRLAIAYYNLGHAYWDESPDQAASLFMTSIKFDPNYSDAYNALGLIQATLLSPPRYDEAITNLKKATEIDGESASAWANLGFAWTLKRETLSEEEAPAAGKEAIAALTKAVGLYEKMRDMKGDEQSFKEAYSKAYNDLGWAYEQDKDYTSAVANYSRSFEINPAYHYANTGKGDAYRKAKKFDQALAAYESVLQQPQADEASRVAAYRGESKVFLERCRNYSLGRQRKDFELAVSMMREAQKIEPESKEIAEELEKAVGALDGVSQKAK